MCAYLAFTHRAMPGLGNSSLVLLCVFRYLALEQLYKVGHLAGWCLSGNLGGNSAGAPVTLSRGHQCTFSDHVCALCFTGHDVSRLKTSLSPAFRLRHGYHGRHFAALPAAAHLLWTRPVFPRWVPLSGNSHFPGDRCNSRAGLFRHDILPARSK